MSRYTKTERIIAGFLSAFPGIKPRLKKAYQGLNYMMHRKHYTYKSDYQLNSYSYNDDETFFGYYDHSPENETGDFLLYHASSLSTRNLPDPHNALQLVLFNRNKNQTIFTTRSSAYNWQQGCRLQWVDRESFVFNDFDEKSKQYISRLIDINDPDKPVTIDYPVYDVFSDFAISLNFDRLNLLRPDYGYRNRPWISLRDLNDTTDGVYFVNLKENTRKLIISIDRLKVYKPDNNFNRAHHKVNHIMISPGGEKFMFLHRWILDGKRSDRLFVSDIEGKKLLLLSEGIVSHCCWIGNNKIFGYLTSGNKYPAFKTIELSDKDHTTHNVKELSSYGDGHPNVFDNRIVFDSYPDKSRMKALFVYNLNNGKLQKAGEFFESMKYYNETRCDLHPRWNNNGTRIYFDSVHEGKRKLHSIDYE